MNRQSNERLEHILDALVASDIGPNSPQLADWIRRYPDFEQELIGFAASWSLMKSLPPATEPAAVDEETLVLRGMSIVQNLLHEQGEMQQRTVEKGSAMAGLIESGREQGLLVNEIAAKASLGVALLRKLDRRLIRFATIPSEAITALADVLHQDTSAVAGYLQRSPTLATGIRYRAEQAPQLTEQEDFTTAVETDPTISTQDRERWLALSRRGRT